jgi:hypothetical protein
MMISVIFPFYTFAGQCDHLPPASAKVKDLSYTTATPSLPLICHHGLHTIEHDGQEIVEDNILLYDLLHVLQ